MAPDGMLSPENLQMEPTCPTACAIMSAARGSFETLGGAIQGFGLRRNRLARCQPNRVPANAVITAEDSVLGKRTETSADDAGDARFGDVKRM